MAFWVAIKTFFGNLGIKTILIAVLCLCVIGAGFGLYRAGISNEQKSNQIERLQEDLKTTRDNFEEYKQNVLTVDDIKNLQTETVRTQYEIRERIRNVPVIAEDRPFVTDPGLSSRVDIMRSHQESFPRR